MARNAVIAGDYKDKLISNNIKGEVFIKLKLFGSDKIMLDSSTVESYDLITEDIRKSASSGVIRGAVGATLLGPVGLLAGLSAKNKGTYNIAIKFKDGKNSLIEIDDKLYKFFIKSCFV